MSKNNADAAAVLLGCHSWAELHAVLANTSEATKGDAFEVLVQAYLRLDSKYDFKNVWSTHGEIPKAVLSKLNLFNRDVTGLDLVAETPGGKFWAVQAKYHQDEKWSLTRKEATGLIAGRNRAHGDFELGLICTTANGRSANLAGEPALEYLMGDVWRGLDGAFFDRLHAHLRGAAPMPPVLKSPRPHQQEALDGIVAYFADHSRGKVVMPCATGKSLIGFWSAEKLKARRVLVAVPNLSLVRQLLKDWTEQSLAHGRRPRWIVVCSDDSVADSVAARDLGVKVDTDPTEVAAWLKANQRAELSVVFTTYQSGRVLGEAAKKAGVKFDLGIFDEAHRTAGRDGAPFAHLLSDDNVKVRNRVFMTATPRIFKGRDRDDVISMGDPVLYGGDAFKMTFLSAMDRGIIPNLTIVAVTVAEKEIERLLRDKRFVRLQAKHQDEVIRAEDLVAALALRKAMRKYGIRRTLGFHSSRKRCRLAREVQRLLGEVLPEYGPLDVFNVDAEMTSGERDSELRAFEASEHALLTNVRVFVEGVDCPSMDAVIFADPKQSTIDIVQGVGRALRPFPGKEAGCAIIPTIIEDDGSPADAAYDQVVRVACALGSENEVVLDYFAAVAKGQPWTGRRVFEVLGDVEVGASVDLEKINRAVAVRTYERTTWRVDLDDYIALAKSRGFKFVGEVVPATSRVKTLWECSQGHRWEAPYYLIKSGNGCRACAGLIPKTIEDYCALAASRGFTFLGELAPANTQTRTSWRCSKGHTWEAPYYSIRAGNGCRHCAGTAPKTLADYHALAVSRGFTFLGEIAPPDTATAGTWRCSVGHIFESPYGAVQQGKVCRECEGIPPKTLDDYYALAADRGFTFLGEVVPDLVLTKAPWQCSKGHRWEAPYSRIQAGSACPRCVGKARRTIDDYRELAAHRRFTFLGDTLPSSVSAKALWQCSKGHRWDAAFSSIQGGNGCPYCSGRAKKTLDDYHALAASRGFTFLGTVAPANTGARANWRCSKGHGWSTTYESIAGGSGCVYCAGRASKSLDDCHSLAARRGLTFLGEVAPPTTQTKVPWQCSKGHRWEAAFNNISNGSGCPFCSGRAPKTIEDYRALAEIRGFRFVGEVAPTKTSVKALWQCSRGHRWDALIGHIREGYGCPHCAGLARKTIEDYQALAASQGITFLGDAPPAGVLSKGSWQCSTGHRWECSYNTIRKGRGCPHCRAGRRAKKST